jgi:hypothetical protein
MRITVILCFFLVVLGMLNAQPAPYTEAQLKQFINNELVPIVRMVVEATTPYPEVNERVKKQTALISQRFKDKPANSVVLQMVYTHVSKWVAGSSRINEKGNPEITLYVPAIMDNWAGSRSRIIYIIMHERDHLTELIPNRKDGISLDIETHIHALTTQYVVVPLKEKHGVTLSRDEQRHYDAWVKAGRTEKSSVWRESIRILLSQGLGSPK